MADSDDESSEGDDIMIEEQKENPGGLEIKNRHMSVLTDATSRDPDTPGSVPGKLKGHSQS